jgi:hypothetical protein
LLVLRPRSHRGRRAAAFASPSLLRRRSPRHNPRLAKVPTPRRFTRCARPSVAQARRRSAILPVLFAFAVARAFCCAGRVCVAVRFILRLAHSPQAGPAQAWISPVCRSARRHAACPEWFCEGSAAKPACRRQGSLLPFSAPRVYPDKVGASLRCELLLSSTFNS